MNLYKFKYSLTVNFCKLTNKMRDKLIQEITESKLKTSGKQQ